jgi:hypothetical protein
MVPRRVEGVGDAQANLDKLGHVERPARQPLLERLAVEQLHREKRRVGAYVVDGTDVRVVERGRGARFPLESLPRLRSGRRPLTQRFDRDEPIQAAVVSAVHVAHPAGAEQVKDFIRPEMCSG